MGGARGLENMKRLTVAELIEKLKEQPQDASVFAYIDFDYVTTVKYRHPSYPPGASQCVILETNE
jgi:hypothetical protein